MAALSKDLKLGGNPKQVAFLAVLLSAAGYLFYTNLSGGDDSGPVIAAPVVAAKPKPGATRLPNRESAATENSAERSTEAALFRPTMKFKVKPDPTKVDPTLHVEVLEKVRAVQLQLSGRNLFEFGAPPPPPKPIEKIGPVIIPVATGPTTGAVPVTGRQGPPSPPPPPSIPLKFFGFIATERGGPRKGFFSEGEEVFVGNEGDLIRKRYRIVKINLNNVVMEDTQFKNHRQTIPLEDPRET
jgi:hypothetical protein